MRLAVMALCALVFGLSGGAVLAHEQKLEGSEWGIVGEEGPQARYVSFAGSGRVFGFGGCNRFMGSYEQHDQHVTISPLAATRMACPDEVMAKEQEFLDLLSKVRSVRADHTLLLLLDGEGRDLRALSLRKAAGGSDE